VVNQPAGEIVVFSPLYPPLGCGFRWDAEDSKFKCLCHGSIYDTSGKERGLWKFGQYDKW